MFGMDAGAVLDLGVKTGKDALKSLNKYLDSKNTARTWYGSTHYREFVTKDSWLKRLLRDKLSTPEIERVFTVRNEDWLLIIGEALPAAHTWFRSREDLRYECSWVPLYLAYKDSRSLGESKQMLQYAELSFSSPGIVNSRPAARLDLWGLVVMVYANGAWSQVVLASDGGFRVNLLAKNFVLNIKQANLNAPVTAHLEPREHPAEGREPLGIDDTKYLFANGQSLSTQDVSRLASERRSHHAATFRSGSWPDGQTPEENGFRLFPSP